MARIVLVADDSPTIQKKALGILKGEGFEVETVSNGVAAIKRLAVLHPVVILADVSMPGRDGYEVCEFVKKSPELSHVPVLLVASDMEPYDDARGAEVKADGIIKKPFEAQDLISIVAKFANQFEAETSAAPGPFVRPPAPQPPPEYAFSNETPDDTPTVAQPAAPDFSSVSEGVAFADSSTEETPGYSIEAHAADVEGTYSTPSAELEISHEQSHSPDYGETIVAPVFSPAPHEETPLIGEEPPAASSYAPPPPHSEMATPSFLEGLEAAAEPVFIEEPTAPAPAPPKHAPEFRTMIFRAPVEIAEPVWRDETVPAPTAPEPTPLELTPPEPAGSTALQPQLEEETPAASPVTPVEEQPEHPYVPPSVTATSLDSFSLDDAAAGQVHFASGAREVALAEPAPPAPEAEAPVATIAPAESAPEAAYTETAPAEPASEAIYAETAPPEAAPEAQSEPQAEPQTEAVAPPPAYDWGLIYTVVRKVVLRMSPPPVPMEVVEEMARRLAEEVATEISSESSEPQA